MLGSNMLINSKLLQLMAEDFNWGDVEMVAEQFVDVDAREQLKIKLNPVGQNFEAFSLYKQKCEEKDKFFYL